jgi:hypothetical protein
VRWGAVSGEQPDEPAPNVYFEVTIDRCDSEVISIPCSLTTDDFCREPQIIPCDRRFAAFEIKAFAEFLLFGLSEPFVPVFTESVDVIFRHRNQVCLQECAGWLLVVCHRIIKNID